MLKNKSNFLGVWAVLIATLFSVVSNLQAQELLDNPGFEQGTNTVPWNDTIPPTSWQKYGSWGWAGWKNNQPAHYGTNFVDAGAWNYGNFGVWYQDINVEAGIMYICSVWARTEGWGSDPHASMMLEFRNAAGATLASDGMDIFSGSIPSPNEWTQYSFTSRQASAAAAYARFLLRGEAQCTAMFDDASVTPQLILLNPDFNDDGIVNSLDYVELARVWRCSAGAPDCAKYDLDRSGWIGIGDLAVLGTQWLTYDDYVTIELDPTTSFQEMDGFGASLTDSSAHLIATALTDTQRQDLLEDLFDPNLGIGLSYLRQPMGSSDFRVSDYTYDDMPTGQTDYNLNSFSIAHDQTYIIPLLQQAMAVNPGLNLMGSPWSAPAWMKTSEQLGYGRLIDSDPVYDSYAEYFVKFIQTYAANGLMVDAITLQNEPQYEPYSYPGMRMEPADQIRLVLQLGPKFQALNIHTKIVIYDHNWDNPNYPITVLDHEDANPYIDGAAFHAYAGDASAQLQVVAAHPDKNIYFTESSGGDWAPSFGDNLMWDVSHLIIQAVRCYAKTVVKWNLALDENHGPKLPGGCSDCRGVVTINQSTGAVTREVEYYSLGHAAKFVRPGALRIDSTEQPGLSIENVAFVNSDGSTVVIVLNPNPFRQNVQLRWKGQSFIYALPNRCVATFRWPDTPDALVDVWITTADQSFLLQKYLPATFH